VWVAPQGKKDSPRVRIAGRVLAGAFGGLNSMGPSTKEEKERYLHFETSWEGSPDKDLHGKRGRGNKKGLRKKR